MSLAPIAISCGEPGGIGPEIVQAAWQALRAEVPFFWIGDITHLPQPAQARGIEAPGQALEVMAHALPVLHMPFDTPRIPGQAQATHAPLVLKVIQSAVELVQDGQASALCTAPIHKAALQEGANFAFPGHTEFLAHLAGGVDVVMMLAAPQLRVVPATIHIPLAQVPSALTSYHLRRVIEITQQGLKRDFGIARPRLAIAGLNPHAGEAGRIGTEEQDWIAPLLDELRASGTEILGPLAADTMFHTAARARYDAAIAMYHDQALIPIKTLAFDEGVNVTLGLPFIRTSPDHGTAFDIAGTGKANPSSMIAALRMASQMAEKRTIS